MAYHLKNSGQLCFTKPSAIHGSQQNWQCAHQRRVLRDIGRNASILHSGYVNQPLTFFRPLEFERFDQTGQ